MPVEFPLSPRTLNILRGRGLARSGNDKSEYNLKCSALICLFETEHSGFGREIEITGFATCPTCGTKAVYPDDRISDDRQRNSYWKCPTCKTIIPDKCAEWTQIVVAKHKGKAKNRRHTYHHKECYEKMYVDEGEDE